MNVTVCLGEPYWRTAGKREVALNLCEGARVSDALDELIRLYPALKNQMRSREGLPLLFMGDVEAQLNSPLVSGATIHMVWPMSGG